MLKLDNSASSQRKLLDLPSFELPSLERLKQHLSICIRAIQPLRKWGPRLQQRQYADLAPSLQEIADELLESPFESFKYTILDLFKDRNNRLKIFSSEDLSRRVFSLLLQVLWQRWTPTGKVKDELAALEGFEWEEIPTEWDAWRPAIKVLDREAKWRLYNERYSK